ncbi:hypothetical protein [Streptomyces glaucus]|uniref:Secreted protein n=1 Tax=Streptomyces glaucus TaxID=284029 RepID=A0ABN3J7M4_9ACTN
MPRNARDHAMSPWTPVPHPVRAVAMRPRFARCAESDAPCPVRAGRTGTDHVSVTIRRHERTCVDAEIPLVSRSPRDAAPQASHGDVDLTLTPA